MANIAISNEYLVQVLQDLLSTPSPSGDTEWAISFVAQELESMGLTGVRTQKGALTCTLEGLRDDKPRALSAHIDTLGAMVAEIKPSGRLRLTPIGGLMWPSVESEGVWVATRSGRQIRGSIVFANGAAHVNRESHSAVRTADNMEVRLDERTSSAEETRVLGIQVGDFVYVDPRFESNESGFIRSRFLDDKACVASALAALKALRDAGVTPSQRTTFQFSNCEEIGHGGIDGMPSDLSELLVLDMAALGTGQQGDEYHCSICVKDSGGPYSRRLTDKVRAIAERAGIDLIADVYPFYSSDGTVYWRGGGQAEVALIGPGVDTSHGYERTHQDALRDTAMIVAEYLVSD